MTEMRFACPICRSREVPNGTVTMMITGREGRGLAICHVNCVLNLDTDSRQWELLSEAVVMAYGSGNDDPIIVVQPTVAQFRKSYLEGDMMQWLDTLDRRIFPDD